MFFFSQRDGAVLRRLFRDVYMDSVFPILNSAELPPYIWGNDDREKVSRRGFLNLGYGVSSVVIGSDLF